MNSISNVYIILIVYFGFNLQSTVSDFPKGFLEDIVESDVVKARLNSRWKWEVWDVVPGTHVFMLYVFNLTNPTEFDNGAKPILSQVGPYAYEEHRVKFAESVNLDLSVNYERNFTYTFDSTKSKGEEDDLINIINIPFVIFSSIATTNNIVEGTTAINRLIQNGEKLTKSNVKVGDVLFNGLDVTKYKPFLHLLGESDSWLVNEFESGRYGVMKIKRGANEGPYTVNSGLKDVTKFGFIKTWNHNRVLPWWSGDDCNMINGTDGTVYPPNVGHDTTIQIYDIDMCRSIQFSYDSDQTFRNSVDEYKFKLVEDLLEDPTIAKKNKCFCPLESSDDSTSKTQYCLKKGVIDISACQQGAPYVISYAHFLNANPEYLENIVGLKPDPKLHETSLTIQPRLGVIISYNKRFQWNLNLKPIPNIHLYKNIKPMLMPILWNDDDFELDPDKADLLVAEIANQEGGVGGGGVGSILIKNNQCYNIILMLSCLLLWIMRI